jgi:FtsP/CotA-like multicopper oxidase with cupredoxin domain
MHMRLLKFTFLLLTVLAFCAIGAAGQTQAVNWTISNAHVVSAGQTQLLPNGTYIQGYTISATANSITNALISSGEILITLNFFSPSKDEPGIPAHTWYAKGTWGLADPSAPELLNTTGESSKVIRGIIAGAYPITPGSGVGIAPLNLPFTLKMGPADGRWAVGSGQLRGTADFNGTLSFGIEIESYVPTPTFPDSMPQRPAERLSAAKIKAEEASAAAERKISGSARLAAPALIVGSNGYYIPDYFNTPNWANSPALPKFVDPLPNLYVSGVSPAPAAGSQYIPVAVPDITTYPGSDYYEIELGQYTQAMHSSLPPTTLRGYRQTNTTDPYVSQFHYLGPVIIAQRNRPVRVKFTNNAPLGDLFLPVDGTIMGAGPYMIDYDPQTKAPMPMTSGTFSQARATLHLHGGLTPWISDGTTHQWTDPVSEVTPYDKGVSVSYVPDMWFDAAGNTIAVCAGQTSCAIAGATNNPGRGALTFFWTNGQSARLLFYHDHAWGITRLNVYAGEAAGYLLQDPIEKAMINGTDPGTTLTFPAGTIPADQIPLVIQDKTFVDGNPASPTYVLNTDPTWAWGSKPGKPVATPVTGDLWWPHVYMPAENPYNPDFSGLAPYGRWFYGPWFFPATPICGSSPSAVIPYCINNGVIPNEYYDPACVYSPSVMCEPPERPSTPQPSWGAEAFLDTMVVNGAAYPKLALPAAKPYRLRILNACHDRYLNLQFYKASPIISGITVTYGGSGYTESPAVTITGTGTGATATATVDLDPASLTYGQVLSVALDTVGSGYTAVPTITIAPPAVGAAATANATIYTALTEVGMVPATTTSGYPANWPKDGREGGAPDPATRGPAMIQIGNESGFLPQPVLLPNQPVNWNMDVTMFNFGNVLQQNQGGGTLFLAPAERADVIVDFTNYAGQTLILYNDAPTAFPALDPHYDYYTGAPDRRDMGGMNALLPGTGPNNRTIMQITVPGAGGTAPANDYNRAMLAALQAAFKPSAQPGVFQADQDSIIVGQSAYNTTYNTVFPNTWPNWGVSRITDTAISFQQPDGTMVSNFSMERKALHDEMGASFDDYGRMAARLGLEVQGPNAATQNFILQAFVDPPTELLTPNGVQIWKFTHSGVDTHPIHFHLFDVQVINRVGWDGFIRLPDPNELGWKDTVRVSGLEDTIVAFRPKQPPVPWPIPDNIRPMNPMTVMGDPMGFSQISTVDGAPLTTPMVNQMFNYGWEYTFHCHILSHEENDMMRPVVLVVPPEAPSNLAVVLNKTINGTVGLTWTDHCASETGFTIQRATDALFTLNVVNFTTLPNVVAYTDAAVTANTTYYYQVRSFKPSGTSTWSNPASITVPAIPPAAPSGLTATVVSGTHVDLAWTDNSYNETGFTCQRATDPLFTQNVVNTNTAANVVSWPDTTVVTGKIYYYRVQAFNAVGTSSWTAGVTADVTLPAAPSTLAAALTNIGINVTWLDKSNNEKGFTLQRSTSSTFGGPTTFNLPANTTSYADNAVTANTTYYYRVRSYNIVGISAWATAVRIVPTSPMPPSGLVVTGATRTSLTLGWKDNSTFETGFYLQRANASTGPWGTIATLPANTITYTNTGLNNNRAYYYRIQAYNNFGTSVSSNTATGNTLP